MLSGLISAASISVTTDERRYSAGGQSRSGALYRMNQLLHAQTLDG